MTFIFGYFNLEKWNIYLVFIFCNFSFINLIIDFFIGFCIYRFFGRKNCLFYGIIYSKIRGWMKNKINKEFFFVINLLVSRFFWGIGIN